MVVEYLLPPETEVVPCQKKVADEAAAAFVMTNNFETMKCVILLAKRDKPIVISKTISSGQRRR